jgi:hypothetical protein
LQVTSAPALWILLLSDAAVFPSNLDPVITTVPPLLV